MSRVFTPDALKQGQANKMNIGRNLAWILASIVMAVILYVFDPAAGGFYPVCKFHRWTGWDCPGCGALRALHALLHGNVLAAWSSNPLLILLLPVAGWIGLKQCWPRDSGKLSRTTQSHQAWLWVALIVLVVFGVVRNLPFESFRWMSSYGP